MEFGRACTYLAALGDGLRCRDDTEILAKLLPRGQLVVVDTILLSHVVVYMLESLLSLLSLLSTARRDSGVGRGFQGRRLRERNSSDDVLGAVGEASSNRGRTWRGNQGDQVRLGVIGVVQADNSCM